MSTQDTIRQQVAALPPVLYVKGSLQLLRAMLAVSKKPA